MCRPDRTGAPVFHRSLAVSGTGLSPRSRSSAALSRGSSEARGEHPGSPPPSGSCARLRDRSQPSTEPNRWSARQANCHLRCHAVGQYANVDPSLPSGPALSFDLLGDLRGRRIAPRSAGSKLPLTPFDIAPRLVALAGIHYPPPAKSLVRPGDGLLGVVFRS